MLRGSRGPRLTYANVVASLALFLALGGTSYAALSITGKEVRNSSLTGADIKNNSVKTADIANRSLLSSDFAAGQLPAGAPGPQGAKGVAVARANVFVLYQALGAPPGPRGSRVRATRSGSPPRARSSRCPTPGRTWSPAGWPSPARSSASRVS